MVLRPAGSSLAPAEDRLWADDRRRSTLLVGIEGGSDDTIVRRVAAQVEAGVVEEARRAWAQPRSETARNVLGLEQFATLPPDAMRLRLWSRRPSSSPAISASGYGGCPAWLPSPETGHRR
jgi:hypothetical protein